MGFAAPAMQHRFAEDGFAAAAILGRGLPPEAERHLVAAGLAYHDDAVAERHLREAGALAPDHFAVLIGFYRFYFYKGRLAEARAVAERSLAAVVAEWGHAGDWRAVGAIDRGFSLFEDVPARFFLFTLKGYAYLQMRLGNLAEGSEAIAKLMELDPTDKVGAGVLLGVLQRMGQADDE